MVIAPPDGRARRDADRGLHRTPGVDGRTPAASTACRRRRRGDRGHRRLAEERGLARTTVNYRCATGSSPASATGARRSRSSTATTAASCRCPTSTCRCCCPSVEDFKPTGDGRSPLARAEAFVQHHLPHVRRAGAARDRHHGHLRRTPPGTTCATRRPHYADAPFDRAEVGALAAGRPVRRRRRARGHAPALRALLHQGAARRRPASTSASRSRGCSTRA